MEGVQIVQLLLPYTNYLLPIIAIIYAIKKSFNQIIKRDISSAEQKNSISNSKEDAEKLQDIMELKEQMKPEYYFKEDFFKLLPQLEQNSPHEFGQFGQYVSLELKCLKFEENKEKLKNEIRKIIVRIAEEDTNHLLNDTSATAQAQNHVVN
ncbi:PREDICTED: uncharacterized protein LOC106784136 [Polistes canadensis]|uniref:uncharacterized protein LOC106784136 n=1 Tax=Polistes canadensis TaxID=91411 RepID=UPI000718C7D6|nr:PREDICTED: uncharacterized protein LOC106784136 [Polistes canadensis]